MLLLSAYDCISSAFLLYQTSCICLSSLCTVFLELMYSAFFLSDFGSFRRALWCLCFSCKRHWMFSLFSSNQSLCFRWATPISSFAAEYTESLNAAQSLSMSMLIEDKEESLLSIALVRDSFA